MHGRDHAPDGPDPVPMGGHIIADEGIKLPTQPVLNFIGAGVTATDNPTDGTTDVTIPGGGGGGGSPTYPAYLSGYAADITVATMFSGYLALGHVHRSGVSISPDGKTVSIDTSGTYEVLAIGLAQIDGPATIPGTGLDTLSMMLEVNGVGGSAGGYTETIAMLPSDIISGRSWVVPMAMLDQQVFTAGDGLKFQAANNANITIGFGRWRVLVRRLA